MAKRRTKRKVTVTFKGRSPHDPKAYLHAVEEVFKPGEIEIEVDTVRRQLLFRFSDN